MASTLLLESELSIPAGVDSFAAFRRWVASPEFPQRGRIDYISDRVEVDTMVEDPSRHGLPKVEISRVIATRAKQLDWGNVYVDATRIVCPDVSLSVEPDIAVVSHAALESGRVVEIPARRQPERSLELEGPPELIVEIVSESSVSKDTARLWTQYFAAGVIEYWIVDARRGQVSFTIWQRGDDEYRPVPRTADGFQHSAVLRAAYRLDLRQRRKGGFAFDLLEQPDPE